MPEKYISKSNAVIILHMRDLPSMLILLEYDGTPDKVKEALRRACSHRRTIIVARTEYFLFNVIHQLARLVPQDCGAIYVATKNQPWNATGHAYRYEIGISGKTPVITWGSTEHTPLTENLFRWMGSEWRRPQKPRAIRKGKARGGRPSGLRKKHPELFKPKPAEQSGDALDLKQFIPRRIIPVDFKKMLTAAGGYDYEAEHEEMQKRHENDT